MPGHVFLAQGDLTRLACDAWLLPCDGLLQTMRHWHADPVYGVPEGDLEPVRAGWGEVTETDRSRAVPPATSRRPEPWLTVTGRLEAENAWYVDGVRQFVEKASRAAHRRPRGERTLPERIRPLLALPLIGTGAGGAAFRPGGILTELLPALYELAAEHDVDLVLVLRQPSDFAAAVKERASLSTGRTPWPAVLTDDLRRDADRLAALASRGQLVLFLGAGVSAGAGLPLWGQLIEELAIEARLPGYAGGDGSDAREAFQQLSFLDQATLIERSLSVRGSTCGIEIARRLGRRPHPGLLHVLLAGLPVRETVTTNYDRLFEEACVGARGPGSIRVLPYDPSREAGRWLLKLHGCVEHTEDIVLSRGDYIRYARGRGALQGIVQAMLVTRHLLFVGFSATDENFHQIIDDVRLAMLPRSENAAAPRVFGTCLGFERSELLETLWRDELDWLWLADGDGESPERFRETAWLAEVFIDYLTDRTAGTQFLMDDRYQAWLSPEERQLREALVALEACAGSEVRGLPAWSVVHDALRRLGFETPGGGLRGRLFG